MLEHEVSHHTGGGSGARWRWTCGRPWWWWTWQRCWPAPPKDTVYKDFSIFWQCRVYELGHLHEVPGNYMRQWYICWDSTLSCKSKQVSLIHTCKSESVVCPLHAIPGILYSSPQNNPLLCKSSLLRIIGRICTKEMTSTDCVNSPIFTPRNSAALRTCVIPEKIGLSQCINYRTSTVTVSDEEGCVQEGQQNIFQKCQKSK